MTIMRVRVNPDGTLQMPVDEIVAGVDSALVRFRDLLPRDRPPAAVPKSIAAVTAGGTNANRGLSAVDARLLGFAFRELDGADASVELRAGTDPTGDLILPINLAANETARDWFGPGGLAFPGGVFLVRLSGTVDGAVFLGEI